MPFCWLKHPHPSKYETAYCNWLNLRQKAGEIKSFKPYPSIKLHVKGKIWKVWKADFLVTELDGSTAVHESKGWNRSNEEFKLKASHFLKEYPKWPLYVNRVRVPADSKRFLIPGLKARSSGAFKGFDKSWLKNRYVWDRTTKRYVFRPIAKEDGRK